MGAVWAAMLAGEWAGRFGKASQCKPMLCNAMQCNAMQGAGEETGGQCPMCKADTQANDATVLLYMRTL